MFDLMRQTSTKQIRNHYQIQDCQFHGIDLVELSNYMTWSKCSDFEFELEIKELNSYVSLRKTYLTSLGNKKVELFDMGAGVTMTNQELVNAGRQTMDETNQAIERTKKVVENTIEVGTQTATTLKGQTDQMGRIVNELDTIHFSIKKASQLVKEIGRQVRFLKGYRRYLYFVFT
ncbi:hypothetical protein UlMin_013196 [Ulmus minor]